MSESANVVTIYQYDEDAADDEQHGKYVTLEQDSAKSRDRYVDLNKTAIITLEKLKEKITVVMMTDLLLRQTENQLLFIICVVIIFLSAPNQE